LPKPSLDPFKRPGKAIGAAAVPVAPSFLDLEQEETVAYDSAVSLPALLAEARRSVVADEEAPGPPPAVVATTTSEIRPRIDSPPAPPHFPHESPRDPEPAESSLHHVDEGTIKDSLVPGAPRLDLVRPALVGPRARPSRSRFARMMLTAFALGVLVIVAIDLSIAANLPWLDPRPAISKSFQAAKSKIPWDQITRLRQQ
jgi:hypothetical protein